MSTNEKLERSCDNMLSALRREYGNLKSLTDTLPSDNVALRIQCSKVRTLVNNLATELIELKNLTW